MAQAPTASAVQVDPPDDDRPFPLTPSDTQFRRDFWLILALAAVARFAMLFVTEGIDYWFYRGLGGLSDLGFYPYIHYWVEYPPVFPWLAVGMYRLTLLFPPTLFKKFPTSYHLSLGTILVLADLLTVALVGLISQRLAPRGEALRRMGLYAAMIWPIIVAIGWYDSLPCAMLFLGLWLLLRGQGLEAGAVTGLGFMTKVFPAILAPVGLKFLPQRRERVGVVVGAVVVTLLIAAPFIIISPSYLIASYRAVFARSSWETVWALLDGYFSYGKVAPLGVRFDPTTADYVAFRSRIPSLPIATLFAVLYAILWFRPVARTPRNLALFTAISTLGFLLYSKGYSPQFIIYVLPFVAILLPWSRAVGYSIALSLANLVEWPLYHEWLSAAGWLLSLAVIARTLLWIGLAWEFLAEMWGWQNRLAAFRLSRRQALIGVGAAVIIAIPLAGATWWSWTRSSYNDNALRPAFDFVRRYDPAPVHEAAFVFADSELYQQFYPYFWRNGEFYLFRPSSSGDDAIKNERLTPEGRRAALADLAREHQLVFFVRTADDWTSRDMNDWFNSNMTLVAVTRIANTDVSVWQAKELPRPVSP